MNLIDQNRLDISELKIPLNWDQKELQAHFPDDSGYKNDEKSEKVKNPTIIRVAGLFCILMLSFLVIPYIPLADVSNSINKGVSNSSSYIQILLIGVYIYWFLGNIWRRRKGFLEKAPRKYLKKRLFSTIDLVPLIIGYAAYNLHFKQEPNTNENLKDPIGTIFASYKPLGTETATFYSQFIILLISLLALYSIVVSCVYIIYKAWIKSPSNYQKLRKYLEDKRVNCQRIVNKVSKYGFITGEKVLWIFPKFGRREHEEFECYLHTISPKINLVDVWHLSNPNFVRNSFIGLGLGFFLLTMGISVIDQILYDPDYQIENIPYQWFFIIVFPFLFGCLNTVKVYIYLPILSYFKLKQYLIKEVNGKLTEKFMNREIENLETVYEILFLKDCQKDLQNLPILPINKPIYSFTLLISFLSPYIVVILSNII